MAEIHLGLTTLVRTTLAASSASDRTLGRAGSAESIDTLRSAVLEAEGWEERR